MTQPYHRYVFDTEGRTFVGKFDEMYRAEDAEGFDSWRQDCPNSLAKRLALAVLHERPHGAILDVGCGKGAFTSLLKTPWNRVRGLDISPTAIEKAQRRDPECEFHVLDVRRINLLAGYLADIDLVVMKEVLSYLANWRDVLGTVGSVGHLFISLYLPPDPIGFVKSFDELVAHLPSSHTVVTEVLLNRRSLVLLTERRDAYGSSG